MADNEVLNNDSNEASSPDVVTEAIDLENPKQSETNEVKTEEKKTEKSDTQDTTKAYSERLKKDREKIRKELEQELEKSYRPLIEVTKRLGYTGTPEEIARKLRAENEGKTEEEILAEEQEELKRYEELKKNDPEFKKAKELEERLKSIEFEKRQQSDYAAIKAEYPDIKAKNMDELIKELGKPFVDKLAKGYEAVDAYEITIKRVKKTENPTPPPSAGSTKSSGKVDTKDYFTKEEFDSIVGGMSQKQATEFVKKNLAKVKKSQEMWGS